jgi:hypothetical protein
LTTGPVTTYAHPSPAPNFDPLPGTDRDAEVPFAVTVATVIPLAASDLLYAGVGVNSA